jgi:hypothetical protein
VDPLPRVAGHVVQTERVRLEACHRPRAREPIGRSRGRCPIAERARGSVRPSRSRVCVPGRAASPHRPRETSPRRGRLAPRTPTRPRSAGGRPPIGNTRRRRPRRPGGPATAAPTSFRLRMDFGT